MKNDVRIYAGIDFSKEKFNACLMMDQKIMGESEFPNVKGGFMNLVRWVKSTSGLGRGLDPSSVLFCGEHTGTCSLGLCEFLYAKGYKVWLENALKIKRASGINRVKTDKTDAVMIATYAKRHYEAGATCLYAPASQDLKTLRSLYLGRDRVVRIRVSMNNCLLSGALDDAPSVKAMISKRIRDAKNDAKKIENEMTRLMETSRELSSNYRILTSFKGVGPITAAVLIIYTSNFTRFNDPRRFACFCGVAPFGEQSGTSINKRPHVSHFANINVKAAIVQASISAMRFNPVIKEYSQRLQAKGKHQGVILNNVKNKLIHILFVMIQNQTLWHPDYQSEHARKNKLSDKKDKKGAARATPLMINPPVMPSYTDSSDYKFRVHHETTDILPAIP